MCPPETGLATTPAVAEGWGNRGSILCLICFGYSTSSPRLGGCSQCIAKLGLFTGLFPGLSLDLFLGLFSSLFLGLFFALFFGLSLGGPVCGPIPKPICGPVCRPVY